MLNAKVIKALAKMNAQPAPQPSATRHWFRVRLEWQGIDARVKFV